MCQLSWDDLPIIPSLEISGIKTQRYKNVGNKTGLRTMTSAMVVMCLLSVSISGPFAKKYIRGLHTGPALQHCTYTPIQSKKMLFCFRHPILDLKQIRNSML